MFIFNILNILKISLKKVIAEIVETLYIPYVVSRRVDAFAEVDRAVGVEELLEKRAAREPHPHAGVNTPVWVEQELLEHPHTVLPGDPEIPPCKEAGDSMTGKMVDPTLLIQLSHDGVNPRESGLPLRQKKTLINTCIYEQ